MPEAGDRPEAVLERVTTGIAALDDILEGGIPRYSIVFIAGLPGSGKTILCEQALFANAGSLGSVLYLSTLSEPVIKMLRFAQRFSFFKSELLGKSVIYGDLGAALRKDGPDGFLEHLGNLIEEHRPELVVIDSFKVLRDEFPDDKGFRKFASSVMGTLSTWEVTALLVGEYAEEEIRQQPEFAIADGIIYMYGTEETSHQKRYLRVMKMRGTAVFAGEHSYEIRENGITVYPRMNPEVVGEYVFSDLRSKSAIAGLDELLAGGPYQSTATLLAGGTGTGKTLVALSFLVAAASAGDPGLLITLEESPEQVIRNCEAFGWRVREFVDAGLIKILHVSPSELDIDAHAVEVQNAASLVKPRMVVIDSISAFEAALGKTGKYESYLWAITDYFKRTGVSLLMTMELVSMTNPDFASKKISFVTDNIVLVGMKQHGAERRRWISALKMRGSAHDNSIHEMKIESGQISIGEQLSID